MNRLLLAIALTLAASESANAEVMDKEPTLFALWTTAIGVVLLAAVLERWRRHFGFFVLPVAVLFAAVGHGELSDPSVGPAIRQEAGVSYIVQAYMAYATSLVGPFAISVFRGRLFGR